MTAAERPRVIAPDRRSCIATRCSAAYAGGRRDAEVLPFIDDMAARLRRCD